MNDLSREPDAHTKSMAPWMPTYNKQDAAVAIVMFLLLLVALYTATLVVSARAGSQPISSGSGQQTLTFNGLRFSAPETWIPQPLTTQNGVPAQGVALYVDPVLKGDFRAQWIAMNLGPDPDPARALPSVATALGFGGSPWKILRPNQQPPVGDDRLRAAISDETWLTLPNGQTVQAFLGLLCTQDGRAWAFVMTHAMKRTAESSLRTTSNQLTAYSIITSARLPNPDPNSQPRLQDAPPPTDPLIPARQPSAQANTVPVTEDPADAP